MANLQQKWEQNDGSYSSGKCAHEMAFYCYRKILTSYVQSVSDKGPNAAPHFMGN